MTSQSLDMILAETLDTREQKAAAGKDTSDLDSYITELTRRSDRMRKLSDNLDAGLPVDADGYGYYVDSDPNTGVIRGAAFMPTDTGFTELAKGTIRTDSMVTAGQSKIPVYLPYVKAEDGTTKAMFGSTQYTGDNSLLTGGETDVALSDRTKYEGNLSTIETNKLYQTFTGKTNIDGTYKKDYMYISPENKIFRFGEDDPKGKQLIESMRSITGVTTIPRLSPADVSQFYTEPLPDDSTQITDAAKHNYLYTSAIADQAQYDAQAQALNYRGSLELFKDNVVEGAGKVMSGISSFFGRKNRPNVPNAPTQSINGQSSGADVTDSGAGFFRSKV